MFDPSITIQQIDNMSPLQFEKYLEGLFKFAKYDVSHVGTSYRDHRGDYGADLILIKEGRKIAVQIKHGKARIFGIREVLGARDHYKTHAMIVITNQYFTHDAKIQAKDSGVEFWDRDKLLKIINSLL